MTTDAARLMERFGVTPGQLASLVGRGLACGGDWCDLFFEDTSYANLLLRDGTVSSGGCHNDYGCGIRVLDGEKTGYAYCESTDAASLTAAADAAAGIAARAPQACAQAMRVRTAPDRYPMQQDWRETGAARYVPLLEGLEKRIRAAEASVHKVIAMLSWQVSDILMFKSTGELTWDCRPLGSLSVSVIFLRGSRTETKNVSRSFRCGPEMLSEGLIAEVAADAVAGIDERFAARRPKGGRMKVVMGAGASGILLHEAMGHAFEADFNRKGQSVFADKMGRQICRKGIDILDDGTLAGNRGACNFDDEGVPGQKTWMVRDGILTSYLHDRISARWYGVEPTGNGRRESFRYHPIPRMRATYMASGADGTLEDLIRLAGNGIYVDQFANGEVKIGEGDFTFYVKSGFLIENGRLTMPVKDINIIGNGPQALADIEAVAGDLRVDNGTWTCGKEQSVPVSCGIPSVLIKHLTVGGQ